MTTYTRGGSAFAATFTLDPIARWESRSGKHWVNLFSDGVSAWYNAPGANGNLGKVASDDAAIAALQAKVDMTSMRRVK